MMANQQAGAARHASLDTKAFFAALEEAVGARHVTRDPELMAPWLVDWRGRYRGQALAMVSPADGEQLAHVVRLCAASRTPIVTQGGNSGMVGGATPDGSGTQVLLTTRRLTSLAICAEQRTAQSGAGVVLQTLHDAAEAADLRFPLSLGGKGSATVGGLISTNAGGTQVLRHGTMRALVTGLEVVLSDGRLLRTGVGLRKDNRGFDLKQLFIGSEGTLGIVTAATLKLVSPIRQRRVVWAGLDNLANARRLLLHCEKRLGAAVEGFEVLPQDCLDQVVAYVPQARPPLPGRHEWHALIECVDDGEVAQDCWSEVVQDCFGEALEAQLVGDAVIAASEAQANAFWQLRESIAAAEKAKGPAVQHDIAVPPAAMPEIVERLTAAVHASFPNHGVRAFGHLGDGNIHFHVTAPPGAATGWASSTALEASAFVYDLVTAAGGTISAEHGIGQDKLDHLARTHDPVAIDVMRSVKRALDPTGLLNPGKLVPLAPDPASS